MEFSRFSKKSWEKLITTENEDSCDEIALDLLDKMLKIDHVLIFSFQIDSDIFFFYLRLKESHPKKLYSIHISIPFVTKRKINKI